MFRLLLAVIGATTFITAQQMPDFTPPTPLFQAVLGGDVEAVRRQLDSGADPNEGRFFGAPPLVVALMQQNAPVAQALIAKGADINSTDAAGSTALMWAAANEPGDTTMLNELLRRGADPQPANKMGDTALTWALRRGYEPVLAALRERGASDHKLFRASVESSLALLQKSGAEFVKVSGCTSCHHQSLPQMAYAVARERGLQVDAQFSDKQAKSVIAFFKPYREHMLQGKQNIPDPAISVSYALIGLGAEGYKPDETTEAMAHLITTQQLPDGSFRSLNNRPPIQSSGISAAALSLRALQFYGKNPDPHVAKAREWLRMSQPRTNEERAMKLLGLVWSKAEADDIAAAARALASTQRADGGWAQLSALESDAYATGQALVALHAAGHITPADKIYRDSAAFLLRTQRPDGSWLVRTRSFPFQTYKESGFPYGKDQWISAAGTSWAAMALSVALPPAEQHVSKLF
jgi:Ankyrin repeats (3 copies)/Squalene-hopene cyclase C-terminal domain